MNQVYNNLTLLGRLNFSDGTFIESVASNPFPDTAGFVRNPVDQTTSLIQDKFILNNDLTCPTKILTPSVRLQSVTFESDDDPNGVPTVQSKAFSDQLRAKILQASDQLNEIIPAIIEPPLKKAKLSTAEFNSSDYETSITDSLISQKNILNNIETQIQPGSLTISQQTGGPNTVITPLQIQFNNNGLSPYITHTGSDLLVSGNSQGVIIDSNAAVATIGDHFGSANNTKLNVNDPVKAVNFNCPNLLWNENYTLPVIFSYKYSGGMSYGYQNGTNTWEMVREDTINFPLFFYDPMLAITDYKIDININFYSMQNPSDKGLAFYFHFIDSNGNGYMPFCVNYDFPYTAHRNNSTYSATSSEMQTFSWSDYVSFPGLDYNNGSPPIRFQLYWYGDQYNSSQFQLVIHFTRTNLVYS